jgi:protein-tyrosine phosphatase
MNAPRFVDLHAHVLPDVDDGPSTFEEAVAMLRTAIDKGIGTLVATPHMFREPWNLRDREVIRNAFGAFVEECDSLEDQPLSRISLLLGAENFLTAEFLEVAEAGGVQTLNGSGNVLVEFSPFLGLGAIEKGCERLLAAGLVPVVAHLERYPELARRRAVQRLTEMGCVHQINAAAITGLQGWSSARRARMLLRTGLANVIASDAHDASELSLSDAHASLSGRRYNRVALQATVSTPLALVGRNVDPQVW